MKFKTGMRLAMAVTLAAGMGIVHAETLLGRLELEASQSRDAAQVVSLTTDAGKRYTLDGKQALRAAVDLRALSGRRVAVALADLDKRLPTGKRRIEAIVPVDDLVSSPRNRVASVAPKLLGSTPWLTIACKFSDVSLEPKSILHLNQQYQLLNDYWMETSYNRVSLAGSKAIGWFVLPHPRAFYVYLDAEGIELPKYELLLEDCLTAAGPLADLTGLYGVNFMINADIGGEWETWHAFRTRCFRRAEDLSCSVRATLNPPAVINDLGYLAHQMGHGYGLPDNYSFRSGYRNIWSLMGVGAYPGNTPMDPTFGSLPKNLSMQERYWLGWADEARRIEAPLTNAIAFYTLDRADMAGSRNLQMIKFYFGPYYAEARKRIGIYDSALPGSSVIIHRQMGWYDGPYLGVADTGNMATPSGIDDERAMLKVGESWTMPDGSQRIKVVSETTQGFVVAIGPPTAFRSTGGNQQPRVRSDGQIPIIRRLPPPASRRSIRCEDAAGSQCDGNGVVSTEH